MVARRGEERGAIGALCVCPLCLLPSRSRYMCMYSLLSCVCVCVFVRVVLCARLPFLHSLCYVRVCKRGACSCPLARRQRHVVFLSFLFSLFSGSATSPPFVQNRLPSWTSTLCILFRLCSQSHRFVRCRLAAARCNHAPFVRARVFVCMRHSTSWCRQGSACVRARQ